MACFAFASADSLRYFLYLNFVIFLVTKRTNLANGSQMSGRIKSAKFEKFRILGNQTCSAERPSRIFIDNISKIKCVNFCFSDTRCRGVNWKEPSTCELFFFEPGSFQTDDTCTYFRQEGTMLILRNDLPGSHSMFFYRNWTEYQQGFGNLTSLYWVGLDRLHNVSQGICKVRIDLQATNGSCYNAQYSNFSVGNSSTKYVLAIGGFSGNIYDSMASHNGQKFTTYDVHHDHTLSNCASTDLFGGGFWWNDCGLAALITSGNNGYHFSWYFQSPGVSRLMRLNIAEVRLLC